MPRHCPPVGVKTFQSCFCARWLPSRVTQRGNVLTTSAFRSRTSSTSFTSAARMSSGSKPATTTGVPCAFTKASNTPEPVMMAAWPAARNPSMRVPGISATISIAAGTYLCAERTEKFFGTPASSAAAVATAVVSKPVAKKTTSSRGLARELDRLVDAVDDVDLGAVGPGVGERLHRARHAQHVAVGADADALQRERHGLVDLGHVGDADRAARPHHHVERAGEGARRPKRAIACSWLPHTCITATGSRPICRQTRPASPRARGRARGRGT